jgi:hypothetical protein
MPSPPLSWFWPPTFARAYALSLGILVLFILWIFFDASFNYVRSFVALDLHLRFLNDPFVREMHGWDSLGPRLILFAALALLAITATITVFARILVGSETERSIKSMLLATALLAMWLGLLTSYDRLWWYSFWYRVLRCHDAMKAGVAALSDHWPGDRVFLPGLGSYVVSADDPDLLYIDDRAPIAPFREALGTISRNSKGDFSFAVASDPYWRVHYMREGRSPHSFSRAAVTPGLEGRWDLQYVTEFSENWYLARYAISVTDSSSASSVSSKQPGL